MKVVDAESLIVIFFFLDNRHNLNSDICFIKLHWFNHFVGLAESYYWRCCIRATQENFCTMYGDVAVTGSTWQLWQNCQNSSATLWTVYKVLANHITLHKFTWKVLMTRLQCIPKRCSSTLQWFISQIHVNVKWPIKGLWIGGASIHLLFICSVELFSFKDCLHCQ